MQNTDHPPLRSWLDLFEDEPLVFRIGDEVVTFRPEIENGRITGWHVTTTNPTYHGYLVREHGTVMSPQGPEPERIYSFEVETPVPMSVGPSEVFLAEFKHKFFGESPEVAA